MANAKKDENHVSTLLGVSSSDGVTPVPIYADPVTHRLYVTGVVSGASLAAHMQTDIFTATNGQTIFTASQTLPVYTMFLSENGAIETPSSDYSVTGNVATLASGVPAGTVVVWQYIF